MKKKVLSLLFACIMILSVLAISGCKSDELQAQIDENATKAETAVTDAAAKAETDLAAAKAELEALIAAGDAADAKDLADAVAKLNSAIDAAKAAATTADDALKADLTAAIATAKKEAADGASAALDAAVKKLNDAVALKVDATAYNKAVADLEAAVAAAKKTASDADAALETKLTAAIAAAKAEAVTEAKAYVDVKVAELEAADAKNVADFNKAIADVNAAIDAAEKLAADADAALKAELTTAIADAKAAAVAEAKAYVDAQVAKLEAADKASADAFNKGVADLEAAIATAQATAEKYAADADAALKAELTTAIANAKVAAVAEAKAYVDAQVAKLEAADKTSADAFNKGVADLEAAIATAQTTAEKYAADADATLKAELNAAIETAKAAAIDAAKAYVDEQVAKLEAADKTNTDAFNKAIAGLETAIADAKAAAEKFSTDATDADAALKAELEAAINTAVTETKAYVDAQVAELKKVDDANKADLAEAIATLNKNIADAKAAAEKIAADAATAADAALKAELEKSIADAKAAAEAKWGDWNDATEVVIEKIAALRIAYNHFVKTYENILSDVVMDKATAIVAETETKLLRAVNKKAAEEVYVYAGDFFATIDGIFEVFATYNMEYYYAAEQAALKLAFETALQAVVDSTSETNVPAIKTALEAELGAVPNKAKVIEDKLTAKGTDIVMVVTLNAEWDKLLQEVDAMIEAETEEIYKALNMADVDVLYGEYKVRYDLLVKLKGLFEGRASDAKQLTTYLKDKENAFSSEIVNKCRSLFADVDNWLALLGKTNEENMKMVDATAFADLETIYEARKQAHIDYVKNTLYPALVKYGADYTYLYDETEQAAIYQLNQDYTDFLKYLEKVGFIDDLNEELKAAYDVFAKGAFARASALDKANDEATAIEDRIQTLTGYLTHLTSFKSAYQLEMEAILADVETWKSVYFDNFAAEKVEGNDNWELLDHAALAALEKTYHDKLDPINAAIKNLADEFKKPGFVTINLLSGDDITNARNAWDALVVLIADLGLGVDDIEDVGEIPGIKGVATTDKIADLFDAKTIEYANKKATAAADYAGLKILSEKEVTIYDEAIVKAMAKWYFDYLGMNIADAASVLPDDGKNLKLSDTLTITDELFAAAKATYAAWALLTEAKINEMNALNGDIAAFLAKPIYTESKAEFCALKDRYMAFMTGEGAKALGFGTEQYAITADAPYAVDVDEFLKAGDKITALEEELKWIFVQIDAFADKEFIKNNLLDATLADKNIARLGEVESYMISFTEKNAGFNCFVESAGTEYKNRELVIAQSRAFIEIAETYASAMANVTKIGTDAVEADLTKRAGDARDAAVELILTLEPAVWATDDAFAAEMAKLNVVEQTIDAYLTYVGEKTEVLMAERYENHVKTLMNTVTAEKVASYEKVNETAEDLVEDVMYSIKDTFAKIGSNN